MTKKLLFTTLVLVVAAFAVASIVVFSQETKSLQAQTTSSRPSAANNQRASRSHAGFEDFWGQVGSPLIRDSYCIGHCDYDFDYCAYYATYYCFHKGVLNIRACLIHGGKQCSERYRACTYLCENPNVGAQSNQNNQNTGNTQNTGTNTGATQGTGAAAGTTGTGTGTGAGTGTGTGTGGTSGTPARKHKI
jgi:hypothetical protein